MSNLSKTVAYLKRNGIVNTGYAVAERLSADKASDYRYVAPSAEHIEQQKAFSQKTSIKFSIVTPVYETPSEYLKAMIQSVLDQTYSGWELILADASVSTTPKEVIGQFDDERIKYIKLESNRGISENTNAALEKASGDYIVLADHDDLLTVDALFEIASAIVKGIGRGMAPELLYTDEDKCDGSATTFYEPNIKLEFNLDALLSNNYFCHITVLKAELAQKLKFRHEYNGAQDFDLVLRAVLELKRRLGENYRKAIAHVPKVLYHWRCHEASTAANPGSKDYAYEAGLCAVEDFVNELLEFAKVKPTVCHMKHRGFYRVNWGRDIFRLRPEIAAVGGYIISGGKITGGIYDENGVCPYQNLNKHYSGYLHRAVIIQEAYALDIRSLTPCPLLKNLHGQLLAEYENERKSDPKADIRKYNKEFAEAVKRRNMIMLLDPQYSAGGIDAGSSEKMVAGGIGAGSSEKMAAGGIGAVSSEKMAAGGISAENLQVMSAGASDEDLPNGKDTGYTGDSNELLKNVESELGSQERLPVSVIIPNYNGIQYLADCVESVLQSTPLPEEIIVVDNGSSDGSADMLAEKFGAQTIGASEDLQATQTDIMDNSAASSADNHGHSSRVKLIRHSDNLGFTGAVNHGIRESSQPFVFLLNNDTTIEPDCIAKLCTAMSAQESDCKIFSVQALMVSMSRKDLVDNAGDSINPLGWARNRLQGHKTDEIRQSLTVPVFTACAGACMYRREILDEIGLFDDRHFAYLEDVDIGYRARVFGYENYCRRDAVVYHKGSAATGSRHNAFKVKHAAQNCVLVHTKNMPLLQYIINLPFFIIGHVIKALFFTLKGLGGAYVGGFANGLKMVLSKDGMKHHIKFRFKNLWNYVCIQVSMWTI